MMPLFSLFRKVSLLSRSARISPFWGAQHPRGKRRYGHTRMVRLVGEEAFMRGFDFNRHD